MSDKIIDLSQQYVRPLYDIHVLPLSSETLSLEWDKGAPTLFNYDVLKNLKAPVDPSTLLSDDSFVHQAVENLVRTIANDEHNTARTYAQQADAVIDQINYLKESMQLSGQLRSDEQHANYSSLFISDDFLPHIPPSHTQYDPDTGYKVFSPNLFLIHPEELLHDEAAPLLHEMGRATSTFDNVDINKTTEQHAYQTHLTEATAVDNIFQIYAVHYTEGIVHS